MERSLRFYRDGLGLRVAVDRETADAYVFKILAVQASRLRIVYLKIANTELFVELIQFMGADAVPVRGDPSSPGVGHVSLYVEDIDALHRHLVRLGYQSRAPRPELITGGPNRGARAVYFPDPDGHLVELFESPRLTPTG